MSSCPLILCSGLRLQGERPWHSLNLRECLGGLDGEQAALMLGCPPEPSMGAKDDQHTCYAKWN